MVGNSTEATGHNWLQHDGVAANKIAFVGKVFMITNVRPGDMNDPNVQFGWTMGSEPGM